MEFFPNFVFLLSLEGFYGKFPRFPYYSPHYLLHPGDFLQKEESCTIQYD